MLRFNGSPGSKERSRRALGNAEVRPLTDGRDWLNVGDFDPTPAKKKAKR